MILMTDFNEKQIEILQVAEQLFAEEGFQVLNFTQRVEMLDSYNYKTTRCPIRIDGEIFTSGKGSPKLGQDNERIIKEFIES